MPEAAIGYFPDCGVARAFARMPGAMGLYLGLTGTEVGPSDAFALGLATHCIPRAHFPEIEECLADADPVDPILDRLHRDAGQGPLIANSARIARYFDAPFLVDILARLEKPRREDEAWAAQTSSVLRSRSPLALALAFRSIVEAASLDVRDTLLQDFRLASRLVAEPDFREGVRAVLIDKDKRPRWRHRRVEDVPAGEVESFFTPLEAGELDLPTRAEMQAARV
jgi:enoyl-CoA hydratase